MIKPSPQPPSSSLVASRSPRLRFAATIITIITITRHHHMSTITIIT